MSAHTADAYRADVGDGLTLYVTQQDGQTTVTLQQGSRSTQSQSVDSREWTQPPQLLRTPDGAVLHLRTGQGDEFLRVHGGGVQTLAQAPDVGDAETEELSAVDASEVPRTAPMEPMKPMKPMKPLESMRPTKNEKPLA